VGAGNVKIYTRTGDSGQTGVIGGRVSKDDPRVEAYGTIDELNSFVGYAVSIMAGDLYEDMKADLLCIQHELFDCGSDLASLPKEGQTFKITPEMIDRLEAWIDKYDELAPDITRFILPGGTSVSSALHVCRTVCRRAERRIVTLRREQPIHMEVLRYVNRLSDLLFTIARAANALQGVADEEYIRSAEVFREHK
jgi:cob(I)alamin adenosyltransferase